MLLVVVHACFKDAALALRNLSLAIALDKSTTHHALLAFDKSLDPAMAEKLFAECKAYFASTTRFVYDPWRGDQAWPTPQNNAWQTVARYVEGKYGGVNKSPYDGWLWWEADAVPLKAGWVEAIAAAHKQGKQPFTGHLRENTYMNGVGVWPIRCSDWLADNGAMTVRSAPFDRRAGQVVRRRLCAINHLIVHEMKDAGGTAGTRFDASRAERLMQQHPQAVLFHGCTDGSLQQALGGGVVNDGIVAGRPISKTTFYHAGSMGDVIYALPTIRALGGGILHLGPTPTTKQRARNPIDETAFKFLAPLLRAQPYITGLHYAPQRPNTTHDLNAFRLAYSNKTADRRVSLAVQHLRAHRLPDSHAETAWIEASPLASAHDVIASRSMRYHNRFFDWKRIVETYHPGFVGDDTEYENFVFRYGETPRLPVSDALVLARYIAGCGLFIGNQSLPMAIAEGMKHRLVQETYNHSPDCQYPRRNATYCFQGEPKVLPIPRLQKLSTSIVCYENVYSTTACLSALVAHTAPEHLRGVIVTNNGSSDSTAEVLAAYEKQHGIVVVTNADNLGFEIPHEAAFHATDAPFFLMLNNDVVVQDGWLTPLLDAMRYDDRLAIVGSNDGCCSLEANMNGYRGQHLEYVECSCALVRREAIEDIGGNLFSPYLRFAYGEDSDLSLRLREKGWKIASVAVPMKHTRASTTKIVPARYHVALQKAANHAALQERWKPYLKRRSFDYRVLVVRHGAHGDVLFTTPIVEALRAKWPSCAITVETRCPAVFEGNPHVAVATSAEQPRNTFDYVFDLNLAYERRPHMHAVVAYADAVDVKLPSSWGYSLHPTSADRSAAEALMRGAEWALLHLGPTTWPGKNWPVARFEELAERLRGRNLRIAVVGTIGQETLANVDLDLRGKTTPQVMSACAERATVFFGLDSFPAHVAEAARCSTVIVCGALNANMRCMPTPKTTVVGADERVPCANELHRLPPPATFALCDGACMQSISVESAWKGIEQQIGITGTADAVEDPMEYRRRNLMPHMHKSAEAKRLDNERAIRLAAEAMARGERAVGRV